MKASAGEKAICENISAGEKIISCVNAGDKLK